VIISIRCRESGDWGLVPLVNGKDVIRFSSIPTSSSDMECFQVAP